MNNVVKVIVGISAALGGIFAAKKVYDKVKESKTDDTVTNNNTTEESTKKTAREKVADAAAKTVEWAADHEREVKGIILCTTFVGTVVCQVIDVSSSMKRFKKTGVFDQRSKEILERVKHTETNAYNEGYKNGSLDEYYGVINKIKDIINLNDGDDSITFSDEFGNAYYKFRFKTEEVAA